MDGTVPSWLAYSQPDASSMTFQANAATFLYGSTHTATFTVSAWSDAGHTQPLIGSPMTFLVTVKAPPIPLFNFRHMWAAPIFATPALTAPSASGKLRHTRSATFTGLVTPAFDAKIAVTIQRWSKKYKRYKVVNVAANGVSGRWTIRIKLPQGKYRLRASSAAYGRYFAASSSWATAKVK
jgi:hypothetical protein